MKIYYHSGVPEGGLIQFDSYTGDIKRTFSDIFFSKKLYDARRCYLKCNYANIYMYDEKRGFYMAYILEEIRDAYLLLQIAKQYDMPHITSGTTRDSKSFTNKAGENIFASHYKNAKNGYSGYEVWQQWFPIGNVFNYNGAVYYSLGNQYLYKVVNMNVSPLSGRIDSFFSQKYNEGLYNTMNSFIEQGDFSTASDLVYRDKKDNLHPYLGFLTGRYMWSYEPKIFIDTLGANYDYGEKVTVTNDYEEGNAFKQGSTTFNIISNRKIYKNRLKNYLYVEFDTTYINDLTKTYSLYLGNKFYDDKEHDYIYRDFNNESDYQLLIDRFIAYYGFRPFHRDSNPKLWTKRIQVCIPEMQGEKPNQNNYVTIDRKIYDSNSNSNTTEEESKTENKEITFLGINKKKAGVSLMGGLLLFMLLGVKDEDENKKNNKNKKL